MSGWRRKIYNARHPGRFGKGLRCNQCGKPFEDGEEVWVHSFGRVGTFHNSRHRPREYLCKNCYDSLWIDPDNPRQKIVLRRVRR